MAYPSSPTYPSVPTSTASVDPVTPPAPASEAVASGGSLADVTFSAFTDTGSRIASYSATKTNVSGSATISGSGLGPYAISGDADGEVLLIELDALDSDTNVLATASYVGRIASAGGIAWSFTSWDATAAPNSGPHTTTSGPTSLSDGTTTLDWTWTVNSGSGHDWELVNGTGLVGTSGSTGSMAASADIAAHITSYGVGSYRPGFVFVGVAISSISIPGGNDDFILIASDDDTALGSGGKGVRIDHASGSAQPKTRSGTTDSNWGSTITIPTSMAIGMVIVDANTVYVNRVDNSTTIPDPADFSSWTTVATTAVGAQVDTRTLGTVLNMVAVVVNGGSVTISEVKWGEGT